jgi:2-oxo-3-hexenedioate decarboxylase
MTESDLLGCIEWVAHGFEIVQSIFPLWKFEVADTVAAYGLHGALLIGTRHLVATRSEAWSSTLSSFKIALSRNGEVVDRGQAMNVLDGPILALKHLVEVLAVDHVNLPLAAGEIITTGTLTRAFPVSPGEQWSTELEGTLLGAANLRFVD